jgi:hypothetical protein
MTSGGCYMGPSGLTCWGNYWLGLMTLALVLAAFTVIGAAVFLVLRHPKRAIAYYGTKRNLVVLPASFLGYMAVLLIVPVLAQGSHLPFWLELLIAVDALAVLAYGLHLLERKSRS